MPNRRIDHDGIINFYHILNKTRELLPHESERLADVVQKKEWAQSQRRYREKNREILNEKRRQYWRDNPEMRNKAAQKWRAMNPDSARNAARDWRARHPDKVKAANARRYEKTDGSLDQS